MNMFFYIRSDLSNDFFQTVMCLCLVTFLTRPSKVQTFHLITETIFTVNMNSSSESKTAEEKYVFFSNVLILRNQNQTENVNMIF